MRDQWIFKARRRFGLVIELALIETPRHGSRSHQLVVTRFPSDAGNRRKWPPAFGSCATLGLRHHVNYYRLRADWLTRLYRNTTCSAFIRTYAADAWLIRYGTARSSDPRIEHWYWRLIDSFDKKRLRRQP